ncbi:lysophospholipid acyltransferase family protein [Salibacter sp.]|uniref:lysophospholipid acyltransferase family protein n=1 Tax=Salibacter sp. TaxID=2010995 RepID=UPI00286FC996|nr:lysophospholipid acyltransferase family protein [Salibacter sp.]MDR9398887.1 lysophospholipid acyltransferase family protein [Salibacter sp.]MDR9488292.1 lysophospholipid acyltransferase family protein [Salibacter sp.]
MMTKFGIAIIKLLSRLPLSVLYGLSGLVYFIVYHIVGYRKALVREQLRLSFPEKDEQERKRIEKSFFHYFADLIVEIVKGISIKPKELKKRFVFENLEVLEKYYDNGQSAIAVMGHFGNWEYACLTFSLQGKHLLNGVYKPLHNKPFDQLFIDLRSRFGSKLTAMKEVYDELEEEQQNNDITLTGLIADQTPRPHKGYWMEFLNRDTPVFLGCERISKKFNLPIVFVDIRRKKRGYYTCKFVELVTDPQKYSDGEITEIHTKALEKAIRESPENWIWTHKRWKHKRPDDLPEEMYSKRYTGGV